MMPFKDGFSLATDIRSLNEEIPLIFLTAKSLKEDVIKGFKIGADDYLIKPFDSEILLLKIKSIFKRKLYSEKNNEDKLEYTFSSYKYNSKFRELSYKNDKPIKTFLFFFKKLIYLSFFVSLLIMSRSSWLIAKSYFVKQIEEFHHFYNILIHFLCLFCK